MESGVTMTILIVYLFIFLAINGPVEHFYSIVPDFHVSFFVFLFETNMLWVIGLILIEGFVARSDSIDIEVVGYLFMRDVTRALLAAFRLKIGGLE